MRPRVRTEWTRRIVVALVCLCLGASGCGDRGSSRTSESEESGPTPERTDARLRLARTLLGEGQAEAALEQLRRLPDVPEHRIHEGHAPTWLGDVVEALLRLRALDPAESLLALTGPVAGRPPALQVLTANLEVLRGDVEAAVGTYSAIRADDPALQVTVLHELATLHLARGEYDLALDRAREGIALVPSRQALLVLAAQALRRKGEPEAALAELARMDASAARFAAEAELYLDAFDRPDTAVVLLERASRVVPRDPVIRQMLGRALLAADEPARAVAALSMLASLPEPFDESQSLLARALRATGRAAEADSLENIVRERKAIERAEELRAEGLGQSYAGEFALALEQFDAALALRPDHGDLHNDRGTVLARMERWKEAEAAFRRATALRPDDPVPWENLARLYDRTGATQARDRALEEAIRLRAPAGDPR